VGARDVLRRGAALVSQAVDADHRPPCAILALLPQAANRPRGHRAIEQERVLCDHASHNPTGAPRPASAVALCLATTVLPPLTSPLLRDPLHTDGGGGTPREVPSDLASIMLPALDIEVRGLAGRHWNSSANDMIPYVGWVCAAFM